jgi:hypothetical protein
LAAVKEKGAGKQAGAGKQRPGGGSRKPGTGKREPEGGKRKVGAGGREPEDGSRKKAVDGLIKKLQRRLSTSDVKPTVGDFLRLLQFQQELEEEEPREVKVQWVEPTETECDGKT